MIAVINAGGSGSRLWPLSTPEYPKHLLKVAKEDKHTLLQDAYYRVKPYAEDIFFITEAGHAQHVRQQLPEVPEDRIIIEPARRGTASCLLLALVEIKKHHKNGQPLIFMHADHVIHDKKAFKESVEHAGAVSKKQGTITLLGVEPTYPSTGFGYIERGERISQDKEKDVYRVVSFKEKPDRKTAETYIREGHYLWNMGYFAASLEVFEATIKADAPKLYQGYNLLLTAKNRDKAYLSLEDKAMDYALIEPASELLVVPGSFDWMDVGNFQDLHTVASQDETGNSIEGKAELEEVSNSYIRNDTDNDIAVIGLDNVAVVMTEHGMLVTNRNHAQKVGEVSKRINGNQRT